MNRASPESTMISGPVLLVGSALLISLEAMKGGLGISV